MSTIIKKDLVKLITDRFSLNFSKINANIFYELPPELQYIDEDEVIIYADKKDLIPKGDFGNVYTVEKGKFLTQDEYKLLMSKE